MITSDKGLASKKGDTLLHSAIRRIELPFTSSEEEKLEAIEFLKNHCSEHAIECLSTAFKMIRVPLSAQKNPLPSGDLRGGRLSVTAAKALARHHHPRGREVLTNTLLDTGAHPFMKESAAFALDGTNEEKSLHALEKGVRDSDPHVQKIALRSLFNSLTTGLSADSTGKEKVTALKTVAHVLFTLSPYEPQQKESYKLCLHILSSFPHTSTAEIYFENIKFQADHSLSITAVELLLSQNTNTANDYLLETLALDHLPESWYERISLHLSARNNSTRAERATILVKKISGSLIFRLVASPSPKAKLQIAALKRIAGTR